MAIKKKRGSPLPRTTPKPPTAMLPIAEPQDVTVKKAKRLPMFGPGIVITIPLNLLPAYMELYHLVPKGGLSAAGTLLVERETPTNKSNENSES